MEDKTKLFVFAKKEVFLIFLFMIVVAITSFIFGVKIGKNYSFSVSSLQKEDVKNVEMLSKREEIVSKLVKKTDKNTKVILNKSPEDKIQETSFEKLREKINEEFGNSDKGKKIPAKKEKKSVNTTDKVKKTDKYVGKWTVQLGSHRSVSDAEQFAEGFRVRGYNPIINEVEVKTRGIWYRVSIGIFPTLAEAKEYVLKEKTLFEGQDYVFGQFN